MKYLFCNRINFTWASFAISYVVSHLVVFTLLNSGFINSPPSKLWALTLTSLVISPLMDVAQQRLYPKAHPEGGWSMKWLDIKVIVMALSLDTLARSSSTFIFQSLPSANTWTPIVAQAVYLALYVVAAVLIGRFLTQRLMPAKAHMSV